MNEEVKGGEKSPLRSKTLHFNFWSLVLVHAVWPFLPESFRHQDYAMDALAAWFTIGNAIIRFFTTEAVKLWGHHGDTDKGNV